MSGRSAIEWTQRTWNPVIGCTRVTAGCDHCYAFALHDQRHQVYQQHHGLWGPGGRRMPPQYAQPFTAIQLLAERLEEPLHCKTPSMIFVNSMSDVFHSQVPDEYIQRIFAIMGLASWHTFQILTKRPGRLRHLGPQLTWHPNIWIGVSIESDRVVARADALRTIPASVRFLSCEPLLGPLPSLSLEGIDWVIVGGESGPNARPMHGDWAGEIRDRCRIARVPFFFKQWGGKTAKAGGRLLDGRLWDEFPQPQARSLACSLS